MLRSRDRRARGPPVRDHHVVLLAIGSGTSLPCNAECRAHQGRPNRSAGYPKLSPIISPHLALRKVERLSLFAQHRAVKGNLNQLVG
jgi:hypothetical protein